MKKNLTKKTFLIGFFSFAIFSAFLMPTTKAQTWTYNGADTPQIQHFSVYPSEWYLFNVSNYPEQYSLWQISHGNISDLGLGNGNTVWADAYLKNKTSGELEFQITVDLGSWSESIGYQGRGSIIPVGNDGKVSQSILNNVSSYFLGSANWEHTQTILNPCSISFWNTTSNNYFMHWNYTDKGILAGVEWYWGFPQATSAIVSLPAQLPPEFSFTTEDGSIYVSSTNVKLRVNITDADNNNNGVIDTDYLYRILINSTWSNWTALPTLIDYDLSSIPIGAHQVTIEVKNMYGVTQEQITIQHIPPTHGDIGIPGYSTILLTAILLIGVSIILFRHQKKSKYRK
jgi:hypothetical protein